MISFWFNNKFQCWCASVLHSNAHNLHHNCKKYPLSPLKLRFLGLIEQYLHNISDPVYSVHQSLMWFLWLNWRKSTFYPVTAPDDSKCWPIVTSSIQELAASNCDVTLTDCSRVVSTDAFLAQWCWGQWFNEFAKDTSVIMASIVVFLPQWCLSQFVKYMSVPSFQVSFCYGAVNCLASDVIIDWRRATRTGRIYNGFDCGAATIKAAWELSRTHVHSLYRASDERVWYWTN